MPRSRADEVAEIASDRVVHMPVTICDPLYRDPWAC